jgi:F-type H+-transporting ATPase subunit b
VEFDWVTFGLEIVNFLVLVWILKRFLYRPVLQTIARRKAAIDQTLADAKAKEAAAAALEGRYRDRLADWEQERETLRARATEEVNAERGRSMAALRDALEQERERRRVVEERELDERRDRLANEALAQGALFAARLLTRLAAPDLESRLVALALEDLKQLPEARRQALKVACRDAQNRLRVTSAFPLGEAARAALERGFAEAVDAPMSAEFAEDPSLLAGVRASIGPWVMHANVQDELKFFAEAAPHGT